MPARRPSLPAPTRSDVLRDVFGDVLPEQTRDDEAIRADWDERHDEVADDERLRREVPPHY